MKTKILILGATGIFGNGLFYELSKYPNLDVYGTTRANEGQTYLEPKLAAKTIGLVDVENTESLMRVFEKVGPDTVINCIGLVKHLITGDNIDQAIILDALLPHRLVNLCKLAKARLIHFSTDCVFSGQKGNYVESDTTDAKDIYGLTKALGEVKDDKNLTIRTSTIGHSFENDLQLIDWFLAQPGKIKGYQKVIYSGVPTVEMGRILAEYVIPNKSLKGLYQVSADPISKYDLLQLVAKFYGKKIAIEPCEDNPSDRSLDSSRFRKAAKYSPPTWPVLIKKMFKYYQSNKNFIQY